MKDSEELKKAKAKQFRYKRPIAKTINLENIQQELWDIQEECENIRWYTDSEDGTDSLVNALAGDDDEAYEFKMNFAELCAECERMFGDLQNEWVPECFDIFFVAMGQDEILGYDIYEHDYYGLSSYETKLAEDKVVQKLKKMTKDELISASVQCFEIYQAYIGLKNRYDNLKAAIDILKGQNTGYLQTIKEIERLYDVASESIDYGSEWTEFDRYTKMLQQEAWIQ